MEDYRSVIWGSESLSLDKLQDMIQNDQTVADEIDIKPRGILGVAELTMYASNSSTSGHRDGAFSGTFATTQNTSTALKDWQRVTDNWFINPNGLSCTVNVESGRLIHLELYIPIFVHSNPNSSGTTEAASWGIQGFKIVRDGVDISGESLVDIWTSQGANGLSTHSLYFDCFDYDPGSGPHVYEVMWKSEQGLHMAIWDQMRTTVSGNSSSTTEPDQQQYISSDAATTTSSSGRYNISDFSMPANTKSAETYVDNSGGSGTYVGLGGIYKGEPSISIANMWGTSTLDAPFAGAIPTAQFIVTDCGSTGAIMFFKQDDTIVGENINADPTA